MASSVLTLQRHKGPMTEKLKRKLLDREVPYHEIPDRDRPLYHKAEKDEWDQWMKAGCIKIIPAGDANVLRRTTERARIIRLRFVYRDELCSADASDASAD